MASPETRQANQTIFQDASISPQEVLAGDSTEFIIRLVIGPGYTSGASRILYDFASTLGQSCPTLQTNEASGYAEVYVSNPAVTYSKNIWDFQRQYLISRDQPPSREAPRRFVLDLSPGLKEGDVVELHWGETTRGFGPGTKISTVVPRPDFRPVLDIRYFSDPQRGLPDLGREFKGYKRPVPDAELTLSYKVLPREASRLRVIRQKHRALLIAHDRFWNVAEGVELSDLVETPGAATKNSQNVFEFADKNVQIVSKRLPLLDHPDMTDVFEGMDIYWGDIHSHSAISQDVMTCTRVDMMPADLMRFARDRAGLDFYAVTDHHVPMEGEERKLQPDSWKRIVEAAESFHRPGKFVAFPAFELSNPRGDVIFVLKNPLGHEFIDQEWRDVRDAWRGLSGQDYMSIPHFHNPGALPEGTWWENPEMRHEPVIEILSCHGSYEREDALEQGRSPNKAFRFDRCAKFFLQNGYRYGFVGNGDDHKGHVGVNGMTAVFARSLDRDAIFEAYRKRHVYATSNARIRLVFTGNGQLMGSVVPNARRKELFIDVAGEGPLKKIDLFRDGEAYERFIPQGVRFTTTLVVDEEASSNWYVRVTQLDNQVAISSPVWFED